MKRLLKNKGARTGVFFGATSGVITTVGLIAVLPVVLEHLGIAIAVINISHYIGVWVHTAFA